MRYRLPYVVFIGNYETAFYKVTPSLNPCDKKGGLLNFVLYFYIPRLE